MKAVFARVGSMMGLFTFVAGVAAVACSAPPAGTIGGDQGASSSGGSSSGNGTASLPNTPANNNNGTPPSSQPNDTTPPTSTPTQTDAGSPTPTTPTTPNACAAEPDIWACFDCCDAAHPGGWEVAAKAFDDCVCQTVCAAACGSSYCAGNEPSGACIQCLDTAQQCDDAATTACNADASCSGASTCAAASQCEMKPD